MSIETANLQLMFHQTTAAQAVNPQVADASQQVVVAKIAERQDSVKSEQVLDTYEAEGAQVDSERGSSGHTGREGEGEGEAHDPGEAGAPAARRPHPGEPGSLLDVVV